MNIQYTSYGVIAWIDSGKAYTAATEEEAREMAEEDSGKEWDKKTQAARAFGLRRFFFVILYNGKIVQ